MFGMVGLLMLFLSEWSGYATNHAADAEADSSTPKSDGDPWQTDKRINMFLIHIDSS